MPLVSDPIVQEHSNAQRQVEDSHEVPLVREEAKLDAFRLGIDGNRGDTKKTKMRLDKTTQTQVEVGHHPTDKKAENDEDEDWQYEKFLQDKFSSGGEVDTKTKILIGSTENEVENGEDENGDLRRWEEENMSKEEKAAWRKIFRKKREKRWSKRQI